VHKKNWRSQEGADIWAVRAVGTADFGGPQSASTSCGIRTPRRSRFRPHLAAASAWSRRRGPSSSRPATSLPATTTAAARAAPAYCPSRSRYRLPRRSVRTPGRRRSRPQRRTRNSSRSRATTRSERSSRTSSRGISGNLRPRRCARSCGASPTARSRPRSPSPRSRPSTASWSRATRGSSAQGSRRHGLRPSTA
jgi:hypothetical protein